MTCYQLLAHWLTYKSHRQANPTLNRLVGEYHLLWLCWQSKFSASNGFCSRIYGLIERVPAKICMPPILELMKAFPMQLRLRTACSQISSGISDGATRSAGSSTGCWPPRRAPRTHGYHRPRRCPGGGPAWRRGWPPPPCWGCRAAARIPLLANLLKVRNGVQNRSAS